MRKRADQVDETRRRIVEAAAHLHGSVGPAETTISGIAREAGVTRLTVYRHFPDEESIFAACSAHWLSGQVPPDPAAWATIADPLERLRAGLADIYRFYRGGEPMLTRVHRDRDALPPGRRQALGEQEARLRDLLLEPFTMSETVLGRPGDTERRRRVRAVVGHAAAFVTWRSLCVEHGLPDAEAVEAMTALVAATAGS